MRAAIAAECERMIALFGFEGRADGVLITARRWREVAHGIIEDADGRNDGAVCELIDP